MVWRFKWFIRTFKWTKRLGVENLNNNDNTNRSMMENALVILIMSLYIVYGIYYVPLLIIFIPVPFVVLGMRNGLKNNIISMAITSLIVALVLDIPSALVLLLIFGPLSIALNYCIKKRKKTWDIIVISTLALFVSLLIITSIGRFSTELGSEGQSEEIWTEIVTIQTERFKEIGMTNTQVFENIEMLEAAYKYMLIVLPSILIIASIIISFSNYLLSTAILRRMGYGMVNRPRLSRFKLPENIIMGSGIMFITAIIMGWLDLPYHNALLLNISLLVGFIFFLQGLAVIDFLLIKIKMRMTFRVLLLFISVVFVPLGGMLFFIGMFDSVFDMRKIGKRKSL